MRQDTGAAFLLEPVAFSPDGRLFGAIRKHTNGLATEEVFKQLMCFYFDGTSRHLTQFDVLAKDTGYAAVIETAPEKMASFHAIKRFIKAMSWERALRFRRLSRRTRS